MIITHNWLGPVSPQRPKVVMTVGVFDGLHLGHQYLVNKLIERARVLKVQSLVLTFDPHPISVLSPKSDPEILTTFEQKAEILAGMGLDHLGRLEFNQSLSILSDTDFLVEAVWSRVEPYEFIIGPDFRYGRNAEGHIDQLKKWAKTHKINVLPINLQKGQDLSYSSSHIRGLLKIGLVDSVTTALGRPYRLTGKVVEGAKRGRSLGFPTANLGQLTQLIPSPGVYAVRARLGERSFDGMSSIGHNPTFGSQYLTVETFIFDFNENIYGQTMEVDFICQMRGMVRFEGPTKLIEQLKSDEMRARDLLKKNAAKYKR